MYAKSFIARNSQEKLTSATTAQRSSYETYHCHLCRSVLVLHAENATNCPCFEHTAPHLTESGQRHCPYVLTDEAEAIRIGTLRHYVPNAHALVRKTHWLCGNCESDFHAERYSPKRRTSEHFAEIQTC